MDFWRFTLSLAVSDLKLDVSRCLTYSDRLGTDFSGERLPKGEGIFGERLAAGDDPVAYGN